MSTYCGTSGGLGPLPSDPDSNLILTAKPAFGGIDITWTYPETNPQAVAHTIIYRSTNADPATMIKHQIATGDFYYDKVNPTQNIEYFYWVQWVSINGTYGDIVGPVSAIARPTISQTLEMLTGQIESGALAQSLKEELAGIDLNRTAVLQEEQDRLAATEDLAFQIDQIAAQGNETLAAIQQEATARTDEDTAIVNQTNTLVAQSEGYTAQVEQNFNAFTEVVDGDLRSIGASFSLKLGADGLIGGFGLNNDGTLVEAGFDVDRFWVGKSELNKSKPFIVENGEVFINEAVIKSLTVDKLRSADNSLTFTPTVYDGLGNVTEPGKLKAAYVDADSLTLDYGNITNVDIKNADIANGAITNAKIVDGSITNAKIGNAAITNAKIGSAQVDTLQIAGQAVTFAASSYSSSAVTYRSGLRNVLSLYVVSTGAPSIIWFLCSVRRFNVGGNGAGNGTFSLRLRRGSTTLFPASVFLSAHFTEQVESGQGYDWLYKLDGMAGSFIRTTLPAGGHTLYLDADSSFDYWVADSRGLIYMESKR